LKVGEHVITVHNQKDKDLKLVLVNKEERLKVEDLIWQRLNQPETETCYIFTQDGEFYVP